MRSMPIWSSVAIFKYNFEISSFFVTISEYMNCTTKKLRKVVKVTFYPVKFRYSEKATEFKTISHLFWNYLFKSNSGRFFEILVAFSEYLNFIGIHLRLQIFFYSIVWLSGAEPSSHWGCCPRLTLRPQSDIIGALSMLHMWQKNLHSRLCFACCYISTLRFQISVHWRGMRISISG